MLEELNHALMLWEILSFYLPAVAAGVIVAVTLLLVCRDRRRRSLALEAPPESRRIAALAESGLVSPEEARRLLAECNALPEVRETAPVPDLPLRLVSAFGRIFGVMKLVLYLGRIGALGILRLMAQSSNYVRGIDAELEDGRLFFALSAFLVLVSVLELAASVRLLRGSLAARNLLVFCWIADFALLMTAYAGYDSLYYALPAAACGIYSLHVLVFRRDAVRRIARAGTGTGPGGEGGGGRNRRRRTAFRRFRAAAPESGAGGYEAGHVARLHRYRRPGADPLSENPADRGNSGCGDGGILQPACSASRGGRGDSV